MITTKKLIETVKNCGQSIIDNAAYIVGDYQYQTEITVSFTVGVENEVPEISAEVRWLPEKEVDRYKVKSND